jgi:hypothetical protein
VVQTGDDPHRRYMVLKNEGVLLETDAAMHAVMDRLQLYTHRVTFTVEGTQYPAGDFCARLGQATVHGGRLCGIVLEVRRAFCQPWKVFPPSPLAPTLFHPPARCGDGTTRAARACSTKVEQTHVRLLRGGSGWLSAGSSARNVAYGYSAPAVGAV